MNPLNNFNLVSSVKALLGAGSRLAIVAVITLAGLTATAREGYLHLPGLSLAYQEPLA